jgi:hypothetical protein
MLRKPWMYLNRNRICGECGNNKTSGKLVNSVQWYRDINEQGKWTGKYLCNTCYHRRYNRKCVQEVKKRQMQKLENRDLDGLGKKI